VRGFARQAQPVVTIFARAPTSTALGWGGHIEQRRVLAEATDDDRSDRQHAFEKATLGFATSKSSSDELHECSVVTVFVSNLARLSTSCWIWHPW